MYVYAHTRVCVYIGDDITMHLVYGCMPNSATCMILSMICKKIYDEYRTSPSYDQAKCGNKTEREDHLMVYLLHTNSCRVV